DDYTDDGDIAYTILTSSATSEDSNYNNLNAQDVQVTNNDNDVAGITVSPLSGLETEETGVTATFTVALTSEPAADVTIALSSTDTTEGTVSPVSLTFTAANWNLPQIVTVKGEADDEVDGNVPYTILTAAISEDANYTNLDGPDVSVTNNDNYDRNGDWIIGDFELLDAIDIWSVGKMDDFALLDLIDYWVAGCYQWDEASNRYKTGCM
ncbi:MAG: hypothetical protein HZA16_03985, partial [Nitrospirae bacterium]|nr:hypothetical protein [Nitrospirota bacterium]